VGPKGVFAARISVGEVTCTLAPFAFCAVEIVDVSVFVFVFVFISLGASFIIVDIATRRAMALRSPPPRLVVVCALVTFLIALSLRYLYVASPWSGLPASSNPMRNYRSMPAGPEKIDTTSEIGRASNRSLGVRSAPLVPPRSTSVMDWRLHVLMRCV
jgi:hypothetical protein